MVLQKNRQAMPTKKKLVKQKATILSLCHKSYLNQVSTRTEKTISSPQQKSTTPKTYFPYIPTQKTLTIKHSEKA
jgi:hypothetical protein